MYIYIYREYLITHDGYRTDEECVFDSYQKAEEFLMQQDAGALHKNFRRSIIKYSVNEIEPWETTEEWLFQTDNQLIYHRSSPSFYLQENTEYAGIFCVGDVVRTKAGMEYPLHGNKLEEFGVVYGCPTSDDPYYLVIHLSPSGYIYHEHYPEESLTKEILEIQDEFKFLRILSNKLANGMAEEFNNIIWHDKDLNFLNVRNYFYEFENNKARGIF